MRNAVTWVLAVWLALHSPIAFAQARAWLPFFADEQDVRILLDRLNSDPDVAFIIPNGPLESEEDRARESAGCWASRGKRAALCWDIS